MAKNVLRINNKIPSLLDAATAGIQRPIVHTAGTEQVIDFYPIKWSNNSLQVFSCASLSYSTIPVMSQAADFSNLPSDEEQLIAKGIKITHVQEVKKNYFWSFVYTFLLYDSSYRIYIYESLIDNTFSINIKLDYGGSVTSLGSTGIELPSGIHYPDADSISEIIFANDPSGKIVISANNSRYGNLGNIATIDMMPSRYIYGQALSDSKGWITTGTLEVLKTSGNFYYPH